MKLNITDKDKTGKEIDVRLDAEEVGKFFEDALRDVSAGAKVPGFRKGKVPPHILELRLGKKLRAEVFEEMFRQAFRKARDEEKLEMVSYPELDGADELPEKNREFGFKFFVDVAPEVKFGEYKGLSLEKEKVEVTDAMVEDVFNREREERAGLSPVEGRPVQKDDRVAVEGERITEGGGKDAIPESAVPVGTGSLPPELDEGLLGAETGQEKEIPVKQPDGKTVVYKLKIKGIQEKRRIIANDDFARDAGYAGADEWREDVRKRINERVGHKVSREMRFKAMDALLNAAEVELPESMIRPQMEYFRKVYEAMGRETGEPADETKVREFADRQLKENLVVDKVADLENITVSDEELASRKAEIASSRGADSPPADEEIRYSIRREKVIDFILANAVVKDKEKPLILKPDEVNLVSEG